MVRKPIELRLSSRLRVVVVLSLAALMHFAILSASAAEEVNSDNIAYGPDPQQALDVCRPRIGTVGSVLLLIHGGDWIAGDKRMERGLCRLAAARGILGVSVGYRLANGTPDTTWPAQLNDVEMALRWLKAHMADFGLSQARFCAYGQSAGGQLAAFLAVRREVDCAVDAFGPVDLTKFRTPVKALFGPGLKDRAVVTEKERSASPVLRVSTDTPPILIIQGNDDSVVSPSQSTDFFNALQRAGAHPALITFAGGHAFGGLSPAERRAILERALDFVVKTTGG
jgi:acetyl esterase/lipase